MVAAGTGGIPDRCPDCDGQVYLERIDLTARRKTQLCRSCGLRYETPIDVSVDSAR